jgi:ABC-2 type transport system ATP-binding protein
VDLAIETHELTRRFGGLTAVDRLRLQVPQGTFFGFLGPNGAGKSTTIRMLTGLLDITSGRATVLGYDVAKSPVEVKRRIGVVAEEPILFDRLTGSEYLTFVGRMYGLRKPAARSRGEELLELMGLQEERNKLVVDYSHGMQKKLSLSAALIHEPRLLFLDEPFEGIDTVASRMIKDLLQTLVARGVTIFLTSHILEIMEKLCSDLAVIHHGALVAQGTLAELQRGGGAREGEEGGGPRTLEETFLGLVEAGEYRRPTLSWLE